MNPPPPDRLVNLTGHQLALYRSGKVVRTLPTDGPAYRLAEADGGTHQVAGVEVMSVSYQPPPLPDPEPGVWLVVSQVAAAGLIAAGVRRHDILYPGPGVSDRGRVVGCRGLRWLVAA